MPTISGFAVVLADYVKETTGTTGTGTYSLNGAATGFQTFVAGVGNGNRCPYVAQLGSDWEVGIGTVASGATATITRDVILSSSNGGSSVNWGGGTKDIYLDVPADLADQIFPESDLIPTNIGDYSANAAEMQTQTDPGELSSESLPTDLAGELARLRFAIAELKGTTYWYQTPGLTLGGTLSGLKASVATTSGTSHDYTSIPSGAFRITGMLNNVSTNGTDGLMLRLGDSGGIETSGYLGSVARVEAATPATSVLSAGFLLTGTISSANNGHSGSFILTRLAGDTWVCQSIVGDGTSGRTHWCGGSKILSSTLDRIRLTTSGGTDIFDAGTFAILVE